MCRLCNARAPCALTIELKDNQQFADDVGEADDVIEILQDQNFYVGTSLRYSDRESVIQQRAVLTLL